MDLMSQGLNYMEASGIIRVMVLFIIQTETLLGVEGDTLSHYCRDDVFILGLTWVAWTHWHGKDSTCCFIYAIDVCTFKASPACLPGQDTYVFLHDLGFH